MHDWENPNFPPSELVKEAGISRAALHIVGRVIVKVSMASLIALTVLSMKFNLPTFSGCPLKQLKASVVDLTKKFYTILDIILPTTLEPKLAMPIEDPPLSYSCLTSMVPLKSLMT